MITTHIKDTRFTEDCVHWSNIYFLNIYNYKVLLDSSRKTVAIDTLFTNEHRQTKLSLSSFTIFFASFVSFISFEDDYIFSSGTATRYETKFGAI